MDKRALFNEFDFIASPKDEDSPHFWLCQDCKPERGMIDNLVKDHYTCDVCGSHTLGPFASRREVSKAYHICNEFWGVFKKMQDDDGVAMPGFEAYVEYRKEMRVKEVKRG